MSRKRLCACERRQAIEDEQESQTKAGNIARGTMARMAYKYFKSNKKGGKALTRMYTYLQICTLSRSKRIYSTARRLGKCNTTTIHPESYVFIFMSAEKLPNANFAAVVAASRTKCPNFIYELGSGNKRRYKEIENRIPQQRNENSNFNSERIKFSMKISLLEATRKKNNKKKINLDLYGAFFRISFSFSCFYFLLF